MIPLAGITMQKPPVVVGSPLKMLIAHQHHRSDDHRDCQKKNCYMYCVPCAIATSSRYLWSSTSTTLQCNVMNWRSICCCLHFALPLYRGSLFLQSQLVILRAWEELNFRINFLNIHLILKCQCQQAGRRAISEHVYCKVLVFWSIAQVVSIIKSKIDS